MNLDSHDKIKGISISTNQRCYVGKGEITFSNENRPKINPSDYLYYGNNHTILLKVFGIEGTKYKICTNTLKDGIWVEFDELASIDLKFNTYLSLLANDRNNFYIYYESSSRRSYINIGVNIYNSCLYLRKEPNINGKIVTCIQNNLENPSHVGITHLEIQSVVDGWADVIVRDFGITGDEYENPDNCPSSVINEFRGFVKVMDDNGRPNIWYALSAYMN
jgi:hypothetical protein